MDYTKFKELVMAEAEKLGITEYELYYQCAESLNARIFRDEVDSFTASREGGVCFRCIREGKMGYASTEELSEIQASFIVNRAWENAAVVESEEPVFLASGGQTYQSAAPSGARMVSADDLIALALDTQKKLYDHGGNHGSMTLAVAEDSAIAIANSKGLDVSCGTTLNALMAEAVVEGEGEKGNDYTLKAVPFENMDREAMAKEAVKKALDGMGGEPAPTGSYSVVFAPKAVSGLLAVFSSVFSAEAANKGLSRLKDQEGEVIAAPCVTVTDDPFCVLSPMMMPFDAEGSPTYTKNVVEAGKLMTLLHNLKTAALAGKQTTGNAAKAGYDAPIGLRPFTMYFAPGHISEEALLQMAGEGVYIHDLQGLHAGASPVTGDFSLQSAGFMIREGRLAEPVKSFTVAGNFYSLLKNVTALADNLEIPGATGKTAFGGPSILVDGLSIAGK